MKTKTKKFKIFKPIVASSLALILGSSLYGQNIQHQECASSGNCTDIKGDITFKFGKNEGTNIDFIDNTITFGNKPETISLKDTNFTSKEFDFSGHTMTVILDAGKTFNLTAEKAVFKGNLTINDAGSGDDKQIGAKFNGTFSHGMEGNITVSRTEKDANRTTLTFSDGNLGKKDAKSTITLQRTSTIGNGSNGGDNGALVLDFSNNKDGNLYADIQSVSGGGGKVIIKGYTKTTGTAQTGTTNNNHTTTLYGNIGGKTLGSDNTKDLIVNFENGAKMHGNIQTGIGDWGSESGNDYQKKVITFKKGSSMNTSPEEASVQTQNQTNDNFVLEGDIISFGTGKQAERNTSKGNHVTFENGSMKGNIKAIRTWKDQRIGYNNVTFKEDGAKLEGKIEALGGFNTSIHTKNDVKFEGKDSSIVGDITADKGGASGFGHNHITFEKNGNITGTILSNDFKESKNDITFNNNNTKENGKSTIKGLIKAESGTNTITLKNQKDPKEKLTELEITHKDNGDKTILYAFKNGGNNTITATDSNTKVTLKGKVDADAGTNTIDTKTLDFSDGDLIARWGGTNIIKIAGDTTTMPQTPTASTLIFDRIDASHNAKNSIAKTDLKDITTNGITDSTNAFEGILWVKHGISSSNNSQNNISYKAKEMIITTTGSDNEEKLKKNNNMQTYIIGNLIEKDSTKSLGVAVSGNNNLYLDLSSNKDFADANKVAMALKQMQETAQKATMENGAQKDAEQNNPAKFQSIILGDISNGNKGVNNIFIKGGKSTGAGVEAPDAAAAAAKAATQETGIKLGLTGNIITNGGSNNIIFEDSIWLPSAIIASKTTQTQNGGNNGTTQDNATQIPLGKKQSGNLINNDGTTNIVLRESGNNALGQAGISMFNVNTGGEATTNIVVEGSVNIGANINYGGYNQKNGQYLIDGQWNGSWISRDINKTTLIFANGNDMSSKDGGASKGQSKMENGKDSFANESTDVKNGNAKVLGVTYKDGIKLTLQDKLIKTNDGKDASFLATYKSYFIKKDQDPILTITTQRESNDSFKDTIAIQGLLIGNVVALQRSEANKDKQATFDVTLKTNSVFFGGFDFSNLLKSPMSKDGTMTNPLDKTSITLIMEKGSKFFTDSSVTLQSLSIKDASLNSDETLRNTFSQSNTVIDLGSYGNDNNALLTRKDFNLLSIGSVVAMQQQQQQLQSNGTTTGLEGANALFRVYVNAKADKDATLGGIKAQNGIKKATEQSTNGMMNNTYGHVYSDRIIVDNVKNGTNGNGLQEYIQVLYDANTDVASLSHKTGTGTETQGNIAVFTVKNGTSGNNKALVDLKPADVIQGFDVIGTTLVTETTDRFGRVVNSSSAAASTVATAAAVSTSSSSSSSGMNGNNYTTYFVDKVGSKGASESIQSASSVALGSNYSLYMANINSLNKRMGELRYNANSQGVWARVFNGMLSSDLNLAHTKSLYTTLQAGYDYAFGMEGANNYLGFALSYINAINDSQAKLDIDGLNKGVKDSLSNGVEVAIYNAYVQDGASKASGWKNGLYTDTILKFSFMNNKLHMFGQTDDYSINNFALTFSQEAGYRFLLGNHNEWFIDPQAELTIGFFDQSEFVQKLGNNYLVGTQNAILNIRGRVGSNFGYKFDHLTENKGFTSQLYLGMYYLGNYTSGGDGALVSNLGSKTTLNALTSHSSFLINVGTNFTIKDKHRIYFDFERSFFGPIITNYQVNLGYRFSFGESKYTSLATNLANEIKKAKEVKKDQGN